MMDIVMLLLVAAELAIIVGLIVLMRLVNRQQKQLVVFKQSIRALVSDQRIKIRTVNSILVTLINWTVLSVIPKTYRVPAGMVHQVLKHLR
jgi:hypothetical protein